MIRYIKIVSLVLICVMAACSPSGINQNEDGSNLEDIGPLGINVPLPKDDDGGNGDVLMCQIDTEDFMVNNELPVSHEYGESETHSPTAYVLFDSKSNELLWGDIKNKNQFKKEIKAITQLRPATIIAPLYFDMEHSEGGLSYWPEVVLNTNIFGNVGFVYSRYIFSKNLIETRDGVKADLESLRKSLGLNLEEVIVNALFINQQKLAVLIQDQNNHYQWKAASYDLNSKIWFDDEISKNEIAIIEKNNLHLLAKTYFRMVDETETLLRCPDENQLTAYWYQKWNQNSDEKYTLYGFNHPKKDTQNFNEPDDNLDDDLEDTEEPRQDSEQNQEPIECDMECPFYT